MALRGISSRNVTRPRQRGKNIYAMKKVGTLEAKKTGVVNAVVKGMPGDDASAASSVTISGPKNNRCQRFLGVCGEYPVELFNIGEEEEFDEMVLDLTLIFLTLAT